MLKLNSGSHISRGPSVAYFIDLVATVKQQSRSRTVSCSIKWHGPVICTSVYTQLHSKASSVGLCRYIHLSFFIRRSWMYATSSNRIDITPRAMMFLHKSHAVSCAIPCSVRYSEPVLMLPNKTTFLAKTDLQYKHRIRVSFWCELQLSRFGV